MPFERPTLTQIDERIRNDIAGRMRLGNSSKTASLFRRSVVAVLSRAYAGACHLLYAFLAWLATQRFVHSMEGEFLDAEGLMYDISRKQAGYAGGVAQTSGSDGAVVALNTICQNDDGAQYTITASQPIQNGTGLVAVIAVNSGAGGNMPASSRLRFINPIPGVRNELIVGEDGIRGGVEIESDEDYRERILARKREPPHGGAKHDYVQWALQVPGVTRAWCLPLWMGDGTVGVMFTRDNDADIIPTEEQCRDVYDYIEPLRPVTAELFVFPPTETPIDVTVRISPDNEQTRKTVRDEIVDFIIREGAPEETLYASRLSEAISVAIGEHHHYLITPIDDIPIAKNSIPVLGDLVFVDGVTGGW